jgi:spoIIIJ-associated protein
MMSEERTKLEVIAPSVEEAIEKGLQELGLTEDDVEVEILDEGKKGLLGLGSRQSRIALMIKSSKDMSANEEKSVKTTVATQEISADNAEETEISEEPVEVSIARETIQIILEKMHVNANVTVQLGENDGQRIKPILIDIEGNDLSFLIGQKAETLNALQFITSLVVGRELGKWVPLQVDVQHFRERRDTELRKLARRVAEQVIGTGRKQILEPMPANERRIIHIELRENPLVETASIGEGSHRKVTILPKE